MTEPGGATTEGRDAEAPQRSDSPLASAPPRGDADRSAGAVAPRTTVILWGVGVLLTLVAFVGVVIALNSTVYSAAGFAGRYLDALDRRDLATLLELPGVEVPVGSDVRALTRDALRPVERASVSGASTEGGITTVEIRWADGDSTGITRIRLDEGPRTAGLFTTWRFAESPLQPVAVTLEHASTLRIGDVDLELPPGDGAATVAELPAFTPSVLALGHESRYLTAPISRTVVADAGVEATVDVQAGDAFVATVQEELDAFLADCATQEVLLPAGCPFGTFVDDRLAAPPAWEIVDEPTVAVVPGDAVGEWRVPPAPGSARVTAEVISLFDGTRSPLDETVPFDVAYRIELDPAGSLQILGSD